MYNFCWYKIIRDKLNESILLLSICIILIIYLYYDFPCGIIENLIK